jgi:hypothetical protein
MTIPVTGPIVSTATMAFVRMLRREFEKRKPEGPNPVPEWGHMRSIDKISLIRCVGAALAAANTASEQAVSA